MEKREMCGILDRLIDEAKVAVLSNIGQDGYPSVRWMSPALLNGREGYIYALTAPGFHKTTDLKRNNQVMWMIQSRSMDEIISVRGRMDVITDPNMQSVIQEAVGGKLGSFWRLNPDSSQVVVLETIIESMEYYKPAQAIKEKVIF